MKKYKIIVAIVAFYAFLAIAVLWINRDRFIIRPGIYRGVGIVDTSIPNRVGDFAIDVAGICIVIGIVAFIIYEITDTIKRRKEKNKELEEKLRR